MQYYEKDEYREIEPLLRRIAAQQAQLRRDRAEIERASLIRQEFTANVSHELKTPLHAISGYAELLESGLARPEDVKPFAGKIRTESGRMTKLVEDIIDLTRLDAGGEDYVFESCDLLRIAENAVDSLETEASGADVTLSQGRERADAGACRSFSTASFTISATTPSSTIAPAGASISPSRRRTVRSSSP